MHQVLVVGAGVAAYAAALRCAQQGLDTVVIVPARRQWPDIPETLSPSGFSALIHLGLDRRVLAEKFPEVREHQSRWGDSSLMVRTRVPGLQSPVILGKSTLTDMLRAAAQRSGAQILSVERIVAARQSGPGLLLSFVETSTKRELSCSYAIDASGRPAVLARQMGTRRTTLDDLIGFSITGPARPEFAACVATISIDNGWTFWASDTAGLARFVFFTAGRRLEGRPNSAQILAHAPEEIARMMDVHHTWATSNVETFNCSTSALEQSGGANWLACGDALQTFDPLASTGVASALQQADKAAQAISAAISGDCSVIAKYKEQTQMSFRNYVIERNAYYRGGDGLGQTDH